MAQLIKLNHYPSRYETNVYRYAGRFTQIKTRRYQEFAEKNAHRGLDVQTLKTKFHEAFFQKQLLWATTTPSLEPPADEMKPTDPFIKQLLRLLDDTTLVLYHPTFLVDDTEIDGDLILLTPFTVWCIQTVFGESASVLQGVNTRKWQEITSNGIRQLDNPYLALDPAVHAVQRILTENDLDIPVKACLLAPESYVEFAKYREAYDIYDRTTMKVWLSLMNRHRSPLKHGQLRCAECLLVHTKTSAKARI